MHHFLLGTLSDWLRTPVSPDQALSERHVDREALLRQTRALRGHEKKTIEESVVALKKALEGDDKAKIEEAMNNTLQASHKMAEAMYKEAQGAQEASTGDGDPSGGDETTGAGTPGDEDVKDADFEVKN